MIRVLDATAYEKSSPRLRRKKSTYERKQGNKCRTFFRMPRSSEFAHKARVKLNQILFGTRPEQGLKN
jgi:hypothetical protein